MENNNKTKVLALLLALVIMIAGLPFAVAADDGYPEVSSVSIGKIEIMDGIDIETRTYYNQEIDNYEQFTAYNYEIKDITVKLKNGDTIHSDHQSIDYNGINYYIETSDDQTPDNQWGIGIHTAKATLFGFETEFEVAVLENPVERIEVNDIKIIEGSNQIIKEKQNPNTGELERYKAYQYELEEYIVTLKNGSVLSDNYGSNVFYNGKMYNISIYDDQTADNIWGVGQHTATANILGVETTFNVEITENPIERFEVQDIKIIANTGMETRNGFNSKTGRYENYDAYIINSEDIHANITLKDGTILQNDRWNEVSYNGKRYYISVTDDQSIDNLWGIGTHTLTANFMGIETTFNVEIIESPVLKVEIEDVTIIENSNCSYNYDYNPDTGYYQSYREYICKAQKVSVTLRDGTVIYNDGDYILYNGKSYGISITTDQALNNEWGLGSHSAKAKILGAEADFNVEIVESPYRLLEIIYVETLHENKDCYKNFDGNNIYYTPEVVFKVTDKDGKSFVVSTKTDQQARVYADQEQNLWTPYNDNKFTLEYINLSTTGTINIEPSEEYEYFEQDDGLYITNYLGDKKETLEIPSEINNKPVVGIMSLAEGWDSSARETAKLVLPDSVNKIGENALSNLYNLKTLTIGSGVDYLDENMFSSNLQRIIVNNNPYYCDIDGVVYDKNVTTVVVFPLGRTEEHTIPASVTNIDILNRHNELNVKFEEGSSAFITEDGVTYNADKTKIVRCDSDKTGEYVMPNTVKEISLLAFADCKEIESITVSNNITDIVYGVFNGCSKLKSIILPNKLKTIGEYAFAETGLKSIVIPNTVEEIGQYAFSTCSSLESVTLSNIIKTIDTNTFDTCIKLESIVIPDSVTEINAGAFASCKSLKHVDLSSNLVYIGKEAFGKCGIENIVLPNKLEKIDSYAFTGNLLKSIIIPKNTKYIGSSAFSSCKSLSEVIFKGENVVVGTYAFSNCAIEELNLPSGLDVVGVGAFRNNNITSLSLPEGVTKIVYGEFESCKKLNEIDIPTSIKSVGGRAFFNTNWYAKQQNGPVYLEHVFINYKGSTNNQTEIDVKEGTKVIADYAFDGMSQIKKINLPKGLKTIGAWAFIGCSSISEIDIPDSVDDINTSAFFHCKNLKRINVSANNTNYKSIDGVLYNKDGTELLWCPKQDKECFEVPKEVTTIATAAFTESGVTYIKITNPKTRLSAYSIGYTGYPDGYYEDYGDVLGTSFHNDSIVQIIICPKDSLAHTYAKEYKVVTIDSSEIEIFSENRQVSITGVKDLLTEKAVVRVEQKNGADISVDENVTKVYNIASGVEYSVSLEKEEISIIPEVKVKVALSLPDTLNANKCRVLEVDSDGNVTDMRAKYTDGKMVFTTEKLGKYILAESYVTIGDTNMDGTITDQDAIYLLFHVYFPKSYPVYGDCDFNNDGDLTDQDAIYLLFHVYFPEVYPV